MFLRMRAAQGVLGRPARRLLIALGVAAVTWALLLGEGGLLHVRQLRRENAQLQAEVARLRHERAQVASDLAALQEPGGLLLEQVARERYGMHREGERVVHVLGGESPATP